MTAENDDSNSSNGKNKGLLEKPKDDEKITQYSDGKDVYRINDTVYIESQRPDLPYYICSIKDFKRSKKDNITCDVVWFYRPCEIPATVYQLLLQDRNAEKRTGGNNILENAIVKERELFVSDYIDMFPASSLRGHAKCNPFNDVKDFIMEYIKDKDSWYYILRYNPDTRRMANAKGEIRIGASHQATLPTCIPYRERSKEDLKELNHTCKEDIVWDPDGISSSKLVVYLRGAGSINSYNGFWQNTHENGPYIIDKNLNMASHDLPIQQSYDMLHRNNYDISSSLQELVCCDPKKKTMRSWTEDERKKFMRGLRSYGKTFHKIRKELLPHRTTCDLIQYYYFWKKSSIASNSRPHKRGGRRHNVLARKTRTTKPKATESSEFLELSSCSDDDCDSDDSENVRDLSLYACRHCYATKSPNWHHAGKTKVLLCFECRLYFKRYGSMRPRREDEKTREPPPYIYKAAFENLEEQAPYSGRMRTRRSSTPVFNNPTTMRTRILQDAKNNRNKQSTPLPATQESDETESTNATNTKGKAKRKIQGAQAEKDDSNSNSSGGKKTRLEEHRTESDDADADDESEDSECSRTSEASATNNSNSYRTSFAQISSQPCAQETALLSEAKSVISATAAASTTMASVFSNDEVKPMTSVIQHQQSVILEKPTSLILEQHQQQHHQQQTNKPLPRMMQQQQQMSSQQQNAKDNTFLPIKEESDAILPRQNPPSQPVSSHASIHQSMMMTMNMKQTPIMGGIQSRHHHMSMMHQHSPRHQQQPPPLQPELFCGSPPSPPVPDDPELMEKISQRFELRRTDPHSTCSRCERIYTFKRPKKQRNPDVDKRMDDHARQKEFSLKRRESGGSSPVISHHQQHHQPAQITSQFEMQRMIHHQQQQQQHHHRMFLPYNYPSSPLTEHHPHRPGSPPRGAPRRSPHAVAALMSSHPAHPFAATRTPEPPSPHPHEFHRGRPHSLHPSHIPSSSAEPAYLRAHSNRSGIDSTPGGDRLSELPPLGGDPVVSGSGGSFQPQLHAHHHTHTHLHLHDELKYRNNANGAPSDPATSEAASHLDRHDSHIVGHPIMLPTPPIPPSPHRPSSRSSSAAVRDLYEYPPPHHKNFQNEALNQVRLREMSRHHMPPPTPHGREVHPPLTSSGGRSEGAASPSFLPPHDHQEMISDPVLYHQFITAQQPMSRKYPHAAASRHGHGQAPDLSPRGLPPRPNPAAEFSREAIEKMAAAAAATTPHMDLRAAEHHRAMEDKMRHRMIMQERAGRVPPPDVLKASSELLMERSAAAYGREDLHPSYPSSYDAALRRMHEQQQQPRSLYEQRGLPEHLLMAAHGRMERDHRNERDHRIERDRLEREHMVRSNAVFGERALSEQRILHERYMRQQEKLMHARSPMVDPHHMERGHERPGYFYKQAHTETIDLSEE